MRNSTPPSAAQDDSTKPWLHDDHWTTGDKAWWILVTGNEISRTMVEIVSPADGTVRDPEVTYNDGVFRASGKFESIRHRGRLLRPVRRLGIRDARGRAGCVGRLLDAGIGNGNRRPFG